ncbi:MAG: hypothetical protein JWM93_747, partial [Frankiales bacterium]|nr:hypothetical protein [Frankiales bacterium]
SSVVVPADGSRTVTVTVRNTGNVSWPLDGSVALATSPAGRASASAGPSWPAPDSPAAIAAPGRASIAPGTTATVAVQLYGNGAPAGRSAEAFRLTSASGDVAGVTVKMTAIRADPVVGLGRLAAGLAAYVDSTAHITVVTSGVDGRAERRVQGASSWGPAATLGGPVLGRPTSVRATTGRVVTVARALDGRLWMRTSKGVAWVSAGLAIRDEPTAVALPSGRVQIFARGADDTVRTAIWTEAGGIGSWSRVGSTTFVSGVGAAYSSAGVFVGAVAKDGSLSVNRFAAGHWTGWTVVGRGASDAAPTMTAAPGSALVYAFARSTGGGLYGWTRSMAGAWGRTISLGGAVSAGPAAVALGTTNVQVFARWTDGRVHVRRLAAAAWKPWALAF